MAFGPERLLDFFSRGHRPREAWRLGLEYEQFVTGPDGRPAPFSGPAGVEALLRRIQEWTGWEPGEEGGRLLALRAGDGRALTLEPGAQLEFNTRPCRSLDEIEHEVGEYFGLLARLRDEFGVYFLALGAQPCAGPDDIERIPKARYDVLEPYLAAAGDRGLWMMKATAGIQVNFDHSGPEDAARKLRAAFALAPVFAALFARSPFAAGRPTGYVSWRGHVWTRTDPQRCGIVEACTRADSTLQDFVDWALAAPMLFVERGGRLLDLRGRTFSEFLRHGHGDLTATEADWELHLSTLFPEVRLRPQLELRSTDSHCPAWALALCALVQGIFYDEGALEGALALTSGWSHRQRLSALDQAHSHGLAGEAPGGRLRDYARELVGLAVVAPEDRHHLEPLHDALEEGRSPGERLLACFEGQWRRDLGALIQAVRCLPEVDAARLEE